MRTLIGITFIVCAVSWNSTTARTLRVPEEYSTLGLAFAALEDADTILVRPNLYIESIAAPWVRFTMMSTTRLDSLAHEYVIIDPTMLLGSDSLSILTLTGGQASFQDIVFRNRFEMTSGRSTSSPAGIVGDSSVQLAKFSRCIFDSVHVGVTGIPIIQLDSCRFIGSRGIGASSARPGKIYASNTWFDGATGSLINTRRGGRFENCLFTHGGQQYMFLGLGDSLAIESCHFVGMDTLAARAVWLRPRCGSIMRDCIFENIVAGFYSVLQIDDSCFRQEKGWDCAFRMDNNRFVNCGSADSTLSQGGEMISLRCNHSEKGYLAKIDSTKIDSTRRVQGWATGMFLDASCTVNNTIFGDNLSNNKPQIYIYGRGQQDTLFLRLNSLSSSFDGIEFWEDNTVVDARQNWWGDISGPFHPQNNPTGHGASVDDGIFFNPWLLSDPDTSTHGDTTESVEPEIGFVPEQFSIRAFPNPFNGVTTLSVEIPRAGDYTVMLYDVTGRKVKTLFSGRIAHARELHVDARDLSSGVYFAQLRGGDDVLAVGKVLLIR